MAAHSLEVARTLDVSRLVPCGLVHRSRLYSKVVRHSLSVVRSGHTLHASVCLGCNIGFLAVSRPATISGLPSFALHKVKRATRTRGAMAYIALSTCATALLAGVDPAPPLGQHMLRTRPFTNLQASAERYVCNEIGATR